ncbi:MAG: ribonuclease Y [bacterium]|nr:ribonuclease Y [bacterium]MDW8163118.1 ribonuclease Y [Candidatus Omnitrophota bacterium]
MPNSINTLRLVLPWFILWGAISILVGYLWRKYIGERTIKSAEKRAKEIIQEAEDLALKKKREIDIEAKELIYRLRSEFEKETKNKRKELQFQEKRLQQKELAIERKAEIIEVKEEELSRREKEIHRKEEEIKNKEIEYAQLIEEEKRKLETISGITREEAKNQLLKIMEEEAKREAIKLQQKIENEAREMAERKAREILLTTMQRLAPEEATESVVSVVSLPSDEIKGRIIGREGRNIKIFEALTGVDLIVDDTPEAVTISCFNLYRRELAKLALERLIADGRIHPARIEEIVEKTKKELEEQLIEDGNRVLFEIGIENVHPELVKLLGKLKYRTSYGQNLLIHSKECAFMAGIIASELGYDPKIAKRAALFHDIGKAVDQEVEGAHPQIGGEILKKYGESEEVVNAALNHHNDISLNEPYTIISQIADALSATRTGARRDTLEKYLRRIEELEKIASSFKGVDSAYAISAGREVRVIVKPEEISDDEARTLAKEIAKKIEEQMEYIGQVKVTVIREKREVEYAK